MPRLFWIISQEARLGLMQYQHRKHRKKLEMADWEAPWQVPPPVPQIPVHADMTEDELQVFMSQPPEHQERVE